MKPKHVCIILGAFLLISIATLFMGRKGDDTSTVTFGNHFSVDNTDARRTLVGHSNALATSGLYYAAWGMGGMEPYENSDGQTVDLYDAQIYLLFGEYNDNASASKDMQTWLESGRTSYDVFREDEIVFCGQTCTRLTYRFSGENVPYDNGISIFGVLDNNAVCIELTCRSTFTGDAEATMNEFLESCTYTAD